MPAASPPAESQSPGRLRHLVLVIAPLAVVIGLLALAAWTHMRAREQYLTGRYIRALATLAEQLEGAIDGLDSSFESALRAHMKAPESARTEDALRAQLDLIPLRLAETAPVPASVNGDAALVARASFKRMRQTNDHTHRGLTARGDAAVDTADAVLSFCRREDPAKAESAWRCGEKSLATLLRAYVHESAIEGLDLFLIDDQGKVLYERSSSGLRLSNLRSKPAAAADKPASTPKPQAAPTPLAGLPSLEEITDATLVRDVDIDGAQYKLIAQPLRINGSGDAQYRTWAIGTLLPPGGSPGERRSVPWSLLAGIPLLVLLAAVALPMLKLRLANAREPLTAATVFGVAASLLVGTALLTAGLLVTVAYFQQRDRFDTELARLAAAMSRNFHEELDAAYAALTSYRDRPQSVGSEYHSCRRALSRNGQKCGHGDDAVQQAIDRYPAFAFLVLADSNGMQREKWTTYDRVTRRTDMREFSAFSDAREGRLRRRNGNTSGYALNVMTSPNTGKLLTVLSVPYRDGAPPRTADDPSVAMLTGEFLSLTDPFVPPDVSFAVIDDSGRVLFHSNQRRRLYENFFAESSGDMRLRSALFARRAAYLNLDYHGLPQRALVQPLADTPWSLIVLRERDALATSIAEIATVVLGGIALCAALLVAYVAAFGRLVGADLRSAVWPDPRAMLRYDVLIAPLLVIPVWMTLALLDADTDGTARLLVVTVGALLALTIVLLAMSLGHARSSARWLCGVAVLAALTIVAAWLTWRLFPWWTSVAWGVVSVLLLALVAGWEPSWLPDDGRRTSRCVRRYAQLALLLLLSIAVLPTAALVDDAVRQGGETLLRARQLGIAGELRRSRSERYREMRKIAGSERLEQFWAEHAYWAEPGVSAFAQVDADGDAGLGRIGPVSADVRAAAAALGVDACAGGPCAASYRHFTAAGFGLLPVMSESALALRSTIDRASSDASWSAQDDGSLRSTPRYAYDDAEIQLPGWRLGLAWPRPAGNLVLAAVLLGLLGYGLLRLLKWAIARLFCIDVWETVPLDSSIEAGIGRYLLRPTPATETDLRGLAGTVLDLPTLAADELIARADAAVAPVLVLGLEHEIDDPVWNRRKLQLIERLLLRGLRVDLVSKVDVLGYFSRRLHSPGDPADASYVSATEMGRWARALARFDKQRSDLPPAPLPPRPGETALLYDECRWTPRLRGIRDAIAADPRWTGLSRAQLLQHIGDLADAHYRTIWGLLTDEERLVLYHLAAHGLVNPRTRDLARRLMRRGLIRRTPALRVMNESFRRFVRQVEDRATIRGWERAAGTSAWAWLRNGVMAVIVVGALVLFFTAPESYARWIAMLTALTTVGGGAAQLLGLFQGGRRDAPSS